MAQCRGKQSKRSNWATGLKTNANSSSPIPYIFHGVVQLGNAWKFQLLEFIDSVTWSDLPPTNTCLAPCSWNYFHWKGRTPREQISPSCKNFITSSHQPIWEIKIHNKLWINTISKLEINCKSTMNTLWMNKYIQQNDRIINEQVNR